MTDKIKQAHLDHSRIFEKNKYLYPVLSRRAKGISIGFNLNQGKECNFDCVYCQIDRLSHKQPARIELGLLKSELISFLELYNDTHLQGIERFKGIDPHMLELKDFCLSGDGEPTMSPDFSLVCSELYQIKSAYNLDELKLVVITNATLLQNKDVIDGLNYFKKSNTSEIWTKLDAVHEDTYQKINRSKISLAQVKENIKASVNNYSIRVQTLISNVNHDDFIGDNLNRYCEFIEELYHLNSDNLKEVQLYAPIRRVTEEYCKEISKAEFTEIVSHIQKKLKHLDISINQY